MNILQIIVSILTLITAIFGVNIVRKYRRQDRFYALKETLLPLIEILENRKYPDCREENQLIKEMFAEQDRAFLKFKVILDRERRDILNKKWAEYKEKRKTYKNRDFTTFIKFVREQGKENEELLKLIYEILETA